MTVANKQLEQMRHNPRDWRIETLVKQFVALVDQTKGKRS